MEWDDLRYFLSVARLGSLTAASHELRVSASTVRRRLLQLEHDLEIPLFSHHQTGYLLTDDGADLLSYAESVEASVFDLELNIAGRSNSAIGQVRIATAENFANFLIIPELNEFHAKHPGIVIELSTGVGSVSLTKREADIAVRLHRPEQGNVNIRKLGVMRFGLYCSASYKPSLPGGSLEENLELCDFIVWSEDYNHLPMAQWLQRVLAGRPPALVTHSLYSQVAAARAGFGLAILPCFLGDMHPDLLRVEFEGDLVEQEIWLVIHRDLSGSLRVRVVADFLVELFAKNKARLEGRQDTVAD